MASKNLKPSVWEVHLKTGVVILSEPLDVESITSEFFRAEVIFRLIPKGKQDNEAVFFTGDRVDYIVLRND